MTKDERVRRLDQQDVIGILICNIQDALLHSVDKHQPDPKSGKGH